MNADTVERDMGFILQWQLAGSSRWFDVWYGSTARQAAGFVPSANDLKPLQRRIIKRLVTETVVVPPEDFLND